MITNALLTTTPRSIIAGTPSQNQAVTCIYLCNITPDDITITPQTVNVTIYVVPAGGNPGALYLYKIYNDMPVTVTDTLVIDTEKLVLSDGDSIWAATTIDDGIVMTVSSVGI